MILKCERCGGSLLWDDGDFCINCGWRPSYAKKPPSLPYPTLKLRLKKGSPFHYKMAIPDLPAAPGIPEMPTGLKRFITEVSLTPQGEKVAEKQADIVTPQIADRSARFHKRWTPGELEYLANYYGLISDKHLAGQLLRTEDSIIKRARYERISQKSNFYTARTLAQVLGVPSPRTIILWVKKGWLKGQRSGKSQSKNRLGRFTNYDVISCLKKRPWLVDLKCMEHHYLRTIIQKEWERNPWYTGPQARALLGIDLKILHKYIRQGLLLGAQKPYRDPSYESGVIVRDSAIQAFLKQRSTIQAFLKQREAIRSFLEHGPVPKRNPLRAWGVSI